MPPSKRDFAELAAWTPATLKDANQGSEDEGFAEAMRRWASASMQDAQVQTMVWVPSAKYQTAGISLGGHVCETVLLWLNLIILEQERSAQLSAATKRSSSSAGPPEANDSQQRTQAPDTSSQSSETHGETRIAKKLTDAQNELERLQRKASQKEAELFELSENFEAFRQLWVVPLIASKYFNDPRRGRKHAERTVVFFFLTQLGVPRLAALAMMGELRNGSTPVDLDHPDVDCRLRRYTDNLAVLKKALGESRRWWDVA